MSIFLFSSILLFFFLPQKTVPFNLFKAEKIIEQNSMRSSVLEVFLFFQDGQILSLDIINYYYY